MTRQPRDRTLLIAASAAVIIVFAPAFGLFRFHDDWIFVDLAAVAVRNHHVVAFIAHPISQHWSPIWHALEVANFRLAGWESDWFIRSLNAIAVLASLLLCARLLRAAGLSTMACLAGVSVLAFHPATAAARFSFDTYSQVISDLMVWSLGAILAVRLMRDEALPMRTVAGAAVLFAAGLLLKEQTLGALVVVVLMLACARRWSRVPIEAPAVTLVGVLVAEAVAFAIARRMVGVQFAAEGAFRLCLSCAPVNVAELAAAVLLPVRTLVLYDAVFASPRHPGIAAAAIAAAGGVAALAAAAVWRARAGVDRRSRLALLVACGYIGSWFPVALLGHVGELYADTGVFWMAMLVAIAVDEIRDRAAVSARMALSAGAVAFAAILLGGLRANLADMRATGVRASVWLARVHRALAPLPDGAMVVVHPPEPFKAPGDYGLYRLTVPSVLVVTGLSPASIRYAAGGRLDVVTEEGLAQGEWRNALMRAQARDVVYRLSFERDRVEVTRWRDTAVLAPSARTP